MPTAQLRSEGRLRRRAIAIVVVAAAAILLSGCAPARDVPTIDGAPSAVAAPSSAPASSPAATAAPAEVARSLARFDAANRRTAQRDGDAGGRAFVDGLTAAGFARADMQVTPDRTSIGLAVPSVQFSVLVGGVCLIGQDGPDSGGYRSVVAPPVDGRCLIGRTRAIDW